MITRGMMSSNTPEWATPQRLFDELDAEFHFTLDPCCSHENAKCEKHYTIEDDGLSQNWGAESVLQSPLRERVAKVGQEVLRGEQSCRGGCHAYPSKDRYKLFPRLHIWQG